MCNVEDQEMAAVADLIQEEDDAEGPDSDVVNVNKAIKKIIKKSKKDEKDALQRAAVAKEDALEWKKKNNRFKRKKNNRIGVTPSLVGSRPQTSQVKNTHLSLKYC